MFLYLGTPAKLWAECSYDVCMAGNGVVRVRRLKKPGPFIAGLRPAVANIRTFRCKVWIRVPVKTRNMFKARAYWGLLLRSLCHRTCRVVLRSDQTVHMKPHCILDESAFPIRKWTRVVRINEADVDKVTVDEDGSFDLYDLVAGNELEVQLISFDPPEEAEEWQVRGSTTERAYEQDTGNKMRRIAYYSQTGVEKINESKRNASSSRPSRQSHHREFGNDGGSPGKLRIRIVTEGTRGETKDHRGHWHLDKIYPIFGRGSDTVWDNV